MLFNYSVLPSFGIAAAVDISVACCACTPRTKLIMNTMCRRNNEKWKYERKGVVVRAFVAVVYLLVPVCMVMLSVVVEVEVCV